MNDPGLNESIENDSNDVENQKGKAQIGMEENEQAFLEPRYAILCFFMVLSVLALSLGPVHFQVWSFQDG